MGILRILLLPEAPRLLGKRARPVCPPDEVAHGDERFLGRTRRVRAHIRDEADRAAVADRLALVEPLRDLHRAADAEADARRVLLQLGRREGRRRASLPLLGVDLHDRNRGALDVGARGLGLFGGGETRVRPVEPELLALPDDDPRREGGLVLPEGHGNREVGDGDEALALALALHDDAERDRLDAPRREPSPELRPEEVRDLVADEAVDDAAGLLRVDAVLVDDARVGNRSRHGRLRDLVELGPVEDRVRKTRLQDLLQVPADGLALAVRVGGEIDRSGALRGLLQVLDRALLARQDLVRGVVAMLPIDRDSLLLKVADVAVAGHDGEVLSEELSERGGLRGRLDDDK